MIEPSAGSPGHVASGTVAPDYCRINPSARKLPSWSAHAVGVYSYLLVTLDFVGSGPARTPMRHGRLPAWESPPCGHRHRV